MSSKKPMPKNQQSIINQYPHYMAALDAVGEAAANGGPLPEKTRHLVQIGAAAAIRSEGAVHSHTRRALAAGATREEVQHAVIAATSTIGFPNVMAALSWIHDVAGSARPQRIDTRGTVVCLSSARWLPPCGGTDESASQWQAAQGEIPMKYRTAILSVVLFLGVVAAVSNAAESKAVQTMATILLHFQHFPSDADKQSLKQITEDKSATKDERTVAQALLDVQHTAAPADKPKLEAIVNDDKASSSVKTLASIILTLKHTPSESDKEKLKALAT